MESHGDVHLHLGPGDLAHVLGVEDQQVGGFGPHARADDDAQHNPWQGENKTTRTRDASKSHYFCIITGSEADRDDLFLSHAILASRHPQPAHPGCRGTVAPSEFLSKME